MNYKPEKIWLDPEAADTVVARNVLAAIPDVPVETVAYPENFLADRHPVSQLTLGRRLLWIARKKGRFLKPCPASHRSLCCNYFVASLGSNCHLECTYCYLQSFLNNPFMVVYANLEDFFSELEELWHERPDQPYRIGTGEIADSLALDPLTGIAPLLVSFFAQQKRAILELKTKSDCVDGLLDLDHGGRSVVSWSMNSHFVAASEEFKTASIDCRIECALRCQQAGYRVGFHFDPMVYYRGWEPDYRAVVDQIFESLNESQIAWISLGGLRFPRGLREAVKQRFPHSALPYGELVAGPDGRFQYFRPLRQEMYSAMLASIRRHTRRDLTFLCSETPVVWQNVFDRPPSCDAELDEKMNGLVQLG